MHPYRPRKFIWSFILTHAVFYVFLMQNLTVTESKNHFASSLKIVMYSSCLYCIIQKYFMRQNIQFKTISKSKSSDVRVDHILSERCSKSHALPRGLRALRILEILCDGETKFSFSVSVCNCLFLKCSVSFLVSRLMHIYFKGTFIYCFVSPVWQSAVFSLRVIIIVFQHCTQLGDDLGAAGQKLSQDLFRYTGNFCWKDLQLRRWYSFYTTRYRWKAQAFHTSCSFKIQPIGF